MVLPFMNGCGSDAYSRLREEIDEVCRGIAEKYHVFDSRGRPKKSFILDVLARNFCPCCAVRELTQMRVDDEPDALYREGHSLAINLLIEALRYGLSGSNICAVVEGEVRGEYGRTDVIVRVARHGIVIELGDLVIIVEVKTGASISLAQILKYAIERPRSAIVVWRARLRQVFVVDMESYRPLLLAFMFAMASRGRTILNGSFSECCHNNENAGERARNGGMESPQQYIDELFSAMPSTLPKVIEAVTNLIKGKLSLGGG